MKVKVKLSIAQYWELLNYLQKSTFFGLTELQILNIRLFITSGLKKLIDLNALYPYNKSKIKIFSIDINQYIAITNILMLERDLLCPYMLATYLIIIDQHRTLISLM